MTAANGNGQAGLDIALGAVMLVLILFTARSVGSAMAVGTAFYALWLWLQIDSRWIPYLKGARAQWTVYERFFAHTTKILRPAGSHLPPDASQLVLPVLIILALITTAAARVRRSAVNTPVVARAQ